MSSEAAEPFDEQALIASAQRGDRLALRTLYQRHARAVLRTAILPIVRDDALARDLLADTFVRAIENLHRYRWQGQGLLPWLVRIAKNICFDHLRRSQRGVGWPNGLDRDAKLDVESVLADAELAALARTRIDECMAELRPRYSEVIRLRLIEQRSRAEAATLLGLSTGTLDVLLCRACKAFRKYWTERFADTPPRWS
jgi:RNA polymerase sigma-70 factor (ECF subfamily)